MCTGAVNLDAAATAGMPDILGVEGYSGGGVGELLWVRVGEVAGEMDGDSILCMSIFPINLFWCSSNAPNMDSASGLSKHLQASDRLLFAFETSFSTCIAAEVGLIPGGDMRWASVSELK